LHGSSAEAGWLLYWYSAETEPLGIPHLETTRTNVGFDRVERTNEYCQTSIYFLLNVEKSLISLLRRVPMRWRSISNSSPFAPSATKYRSVIEQKLLREVQSVNQE
jgi:hypothetical protein